MIAEALFYSLFREKKKLETQLHGVEKVMLSAAL